MFVCMFVCLFLYTYMFVIHPDMRKVYATVVLYDEEHLVRKDGQAFDNAHFNANPELYTSTFGKEVGLCLPLYK